MNKVKAGANFFCAHSESIIENCQLHLGVLAFTKEDSSSIIENYQLCETIIYY